MEILEQAEKGDSSWWVYEVPPIQSSFLLSMPDVREAQKVVVCTLGSLR